MVLLDRLVIYIPLIFDFIILSEYSVGESFAPMCSVSTFASTASASTSASVQSSKDITCGGEYSHIQLFVDLGPPKSCAYEYDYVVNFYRLNEA